VIPITAQRISALSRVKVLPGIAGNSFGGCPGPPHLYVPPRDEVDLLLDLGVEHLGPTRRSCRLPDRPACAWAIGNGRNPRQGTGAHVIAARAVINEPDDSRLLKDVMGDKPGSGPRDEKGRFASPATEALAVQPKRKGKRN
jgi:hypothetical protein